MTMTETPQAKMKARLEEMGIAYKEIEVYGSQIVVTAWSASAAKQWTELLAKFSKVRGSTRSLDQVKVNTDPRRNRSYVTVYRVFARVTSTQVTV